jgi:hypothetical protein
MSEYRFQGVAGLVTRTTNPDLGLTLSVWCGVQSGMQTNVRMGRWIAVCESHAKFALFHTLKEAKEAIAKNTTFCEPCDC